MNRTLLLILCDFLLLNLLALTRWEKVDEVPARPVPEAVRAVAKTAEEDLVATMRSALEEERAARERTEQALKGQLSSRDEALRALDTRRQELESGLAQTRQVASELGQRLTNTASQAAAAQQRLAQEVAAAQEKLAQETAAAAQRVAAATARIVETEKARDAAAAVAQTTEAERRKLQEVLAGEREAQRRQQQAMAALEQEKLRADRRAAELAAAVKVAEAERSLLRDNVNDLRQQVNRVQTEKEKIQAQTAVLASGVTQLAANSEALKQELRENTPVSANLLFQDFLTNRVQVVVGGVGSGPFGGAVVREKQASTVLVTDGTQVMALLHAVDTPFIPANPAIGLDQPKVSVSGPGGVLAAAAATFLRADPRCLGVPVTGAVQRPGLRVYPLAKNPYRFPDALLVSRGGRYYGEVEFRIDTKTPGYVRMKTRILSRIFGEFSPSTGDIVVSRTGEILGIMVNPEYCAVLTDLQPSPGGSLEGTMTRSAVVQKLQQQHAVLERLPFVLQ